MALKYILGIVSRKLKQLLQDKRFLWFVIALFVFQAIWIAVSFKYPMIYDEARHVPIIEVYASGFPPFSGDQPTRYDRYGSLNLATSGYTASFYHYMMAPFFALTDVFTDQLEYKVVILRFLNIFMAATGIYLLARLFTIIAVPKLYGNLALLIYVMLPIVPFVAAHVNYDNALLPLTILYLIVATKILRSKNKKNLLIDTGWLVALGCVTSLIKYTFMPVLLGSMVFIFGWLMYRHGLRGVLSRAKPEFRNIRLPLMTTWLVVVVASVSLFSFVYIGNVVRYGKPKPECEKIMSIKRCMRSSIAKRNLVAQQTSHTRPLKDFPTYIGLWYGSMVEFTGNTGYVGSNLEPVLARPLPVMRNIIYFGAISAIGMILYAWRSLKMSIEMKHILFAGLILLIFVFIDNYSVYRHFHAVYGTQPRYLLTFVPFMLVLTISSAAFTLRRIPEGIKVILLVVFMYLLMQGGGLITHIIRGEATWYHDNSLIQHLNSTAKYMLEPVILK